MNDWPTNLETIRDVVSFLNECVALKPENLPQEHQEKIAASIVHLHSYDRYGDTWKSRYPQLEEVVTLAEGLEWSNTDRGGWRQLEDRAAILDSIVNHKFRRRDNYGRLSKIVVITQALDYWAECLKSPGGRQEVAKRMIEISGNKYFLDNFYHLDKIFAEVFDVLCDYAVTGTSPWRPWKHVEQLVGLLQERWSD